jgi:two-component system OmpR family sensor kinase
VSPSARRWLGLEGDVSRLAEIWANLEGAPADLERAVEAGEARDFLLRRDEPPLFLKAGLRPVRDAEGAPTGAVLSLRDVTRETLERKLQQDVLSLVSHKFRTPLTVINSWVQVLLEGGCGEINAQQEEVLESVAGAGEELRSVLDGILAYLEWTRRLQRLQRSQIGLADLARDLAQRVQEKIGDEAPVDIECQAEGGILVDPALFLDALMELVRNGLKFGGTRVQVTLSQAEGCSLIEVRDDGPGIPPEDRERIFERFYQIESEFTGQTHGLGLGLSMVQRAMDAMGAELEVQSQLQQGTCFRIRIES